MARLILNPEHRPWFDRAGVDPFLARLSIERPFFELFEPLGWAALELCNRQCQTSGIPSANMIAFMRSRGILESIGEALGWFQTKPVKELGSVVWLVRREGLVEPPYGIPRPAQGALPLEVLQDLLAVRPSTTIWVTEPRGARERPLNDVLAEGKRIRR